MAEQRMWINGVVGETGLLPDEGLFFGRGVFETLRVGEVPWFLEAHMRRLREGTAKIGIGLTMDSNTILSLVEGASMRDCAMRITVTPKNWIVNTRPLPYDDKETQTGLRICMGETRRNPQGRLAGVKSTSYVESLLEREAATAKGFREAILLNTEGMLAEGSASNLFFVRDGKVFTPSTDCGLLPGIVRQWVLDWNTYVDGPFTFTVREGMYRLEDLLSADEVFLTNSLMGIMGVRELDGFAAWETGKVTRWLQARYAAADKK